MMALLVEMVCVLPTRPELPFLALRASPEVRARNQNHAFTIHEATNSAYQESVTANP
jgi:hypothetical protein